MRRDLLTELYAAPTRAMVLSSEGSALDYDVSTRPKDVQRSWGNLENGAEIAAPVILIQGLRDVAIWPSGTLHF
jgi:hypothetical protein